MKWISFMYTYFPSLLSLLSTPHPTPLGHQRALNSASCAIQQLPTSYLYYTWYCMLVLYWIIYIVVVMCCMLNSQEFRYNRININAFNISIWASLVAQTIKNLPAKQETQVDPWVWKIPWRREWQPTPIFLPGEFHGQRSLEGYSPWGHRKSDMTEWLGRYAV